MPGTLSGRTYTDDARRMADMMNLHAIVKSKGWAVFALADGRSDGIPYDDISDAYRAKKWDRDNFLYLQIPAGGVHRPGRNAGMSRLRPRAAQGRLPAARSP